MTEHPKCYSYVNSNNDHLEKLGIERVKPCKECELLEQCVAAYNARVYNEWVDDFHGYDQDQFERDMAWGEMMDEQNRTENEAFEQEFGDDWRGVQ